MPDAVKHMVQVVLDAIKNDYDIVWDQTSTTKLSRLKKIRMLPPKYKKVAVVFQTPEEKELKRRLDSRPGKEIPTHVMKSMIAGQTDPIEDEGFDQIIYL